jgi:archaellin
VRPVPHTRNRKERKYDDVAAGADGGAAGGNLVDALSGHHLGPNTKFTLEIKPPTGAVLSFERTTPGYIDTVMNLN